MPRYSGHRGGGCLGRRDDSGLCAKASHGAALAGIGRCGSTRVRAPTTPPPIIDHRKRLWDRRSEIATRPSVFFFQKAESNRTRGGFTDLPNNSLVADLIESVIGA